MTTATDNLKAAATGGAMIVDWVLNGSQITPDDLRAVLQKHGFDPSVVPAIDQTAAVKRVAGSWRITRQGYASQIVKAAETTDELVISVRHAKEGTRRADAPHVCELVWDKVNEQWAPYQCPPDHAAAVRQLIDACDRERSHLDHDFIRPVLIQAPLKAMGSVPFIRRSGGAQVVAATHEAEVNRICDLVCDIGDCYMDSVSADLGKARTQRAVERSVQRGIMAKVIEAREDLRKWRERGTRLPTGSIGSRLAAFKELRANVQMYAECLQMRADDMLVELADAEAEAKDLLAVALGDKPAPKPEPEPAPGPSVPAEAKADASPDVAAAM